MSRYRIEIECESAQADGWSCHVSVFDGERPPPISTHRVFVSPEDRARLSPDSADPEDLVRRSFAFLLERESPTSILQTFNLSVIGRYFPEYEAEIRRVGGSA